MSTNKLYFTILVAALSMAFMPSMVRAQGFHPCKTNENYDKLEKSNPDLYKQLMDERIKHKADIKDRFDGVRIRKASTIYVLPIVFHIIHNGGAGEIPESDILETMDMLNEDFGGASPYINDIDPDFAALYGDIGFEFRLAQIDPDGGCSNGINYYQNADHYDDDEGGLIEWVQNQWGNPWAYNEYVNIFVVTSPGDAYAYIASKNNNSTGVVVHYGYLGAKGVGSPSTDERSWMTHELGHFFSLAHTWGNGEDAGNGGNCGSDDGFADTPETIGTYDCVSQTTCDGNKDMIQNVMDYTQCAFFFTPDQKAAMVTSITSNGHNNMYSASNLIATGVQDPYVYADISGCDVSSCTITTICNDPINGSASVEVSGVGSPFDIEWSNGATETGLASGATNTQTTLASGTVTVTLTDDNSNTATCTATISSTPEITLSSIPTDAFDCGVGCDGSIALTASGAGIGSATVQFNTTGSGDDGEANMADGDCNSDAFYIDFIPNLSYANVDENSIASICVGFTHPSPADLTFSVVTITGGGAYKYLDLVEVGDIPNGANIDYACFTRDATASISTGTAPFTGEWKPTEDFTTPGFDLDGTVTTNYWYLSAWDCDGNGQTGSIDYFEVNFYDGADNTAFVWSNTDATKDIADLCYGTYTVTVTDNNGCSTTHDEMVGCPVGIEDRLDEDTKIYQDRPGRIKITSKNTVESASVYDLSGKLVFNGQVRDNNIRLSESREGMHLVKINTANKVDDA